MKVSHTYIYNIGQLGHNVESDCRPTNFIFKLIDLIKDEDEENVLPEEDQSDVELTDVESESNGKSNAGRKHKALDSSSDSEEEIDEDVIGETDEEAMAVDT